MTRCLLITSVVFILATKNAIADLYDGEDAIYTDIDYSLTQVDDWDDFGYGANQSELDEDPFHYYGDDSHAYYDAFGLYSNPILEDDVLAAKDVSPKDCTEDADGKAKLIEPICHLKIEGVDAIAEKLDGGVDGIYDVAGCYNGRPKYIRNNSPKNEERVVWFSDAYTDWDICRGTHPNETSILMYGGSKVSELRPNYVPADKWFVATALTNLNASGPMFVPVGLPMTCGNGKALQAQNIKPDTIFQPVLSPTEMEDKYRAVYTQYGKGGGYPRVNFMLLSICILVGVSAAMTVPYLMRSKNGTKSFAQTLEESRKQRGGHVL